MWIEEVAILESLNHRIVESLSGLVWVRMEAEQHTSWSDRVKEDTDEEGASRDGACSQCVHQRQSVCERATGRRYSSWVLVEDLWVV